MQNQIEQFKKRFGNKTRISDDLLELLFEEYADVLTDEVGREILIELVVLLSDSLIGVMNGDDEKTGLFKEYKKIFNVWADIIEKNTVTGFDFDDLGGLNDREKDILMQKLKPDEFNNYAGVLLGLDKFMYAFNTEIGKKIINDINISIGNTLKTAWIGAEMNGRVVKYKAYKHIKSILMQKTATRESILKRMKHVIYGR